MRRVQSAPANLCTLAHRRAPKTEAAHAAVAPARVGEAEAMNELVTSVAAEAHVTDSTEQLLLYMLTRWLVKMEEVVWTVAVQQLVRRLAVSFVSHHIMTVFWEAVHRALPA